MTKESPTLAELRLAIDAADEIVLRALSARFRAVEQIGDIKREKGLPTEDKQREAEMKKHWKESAKALKVPEELALLMLDFLLVESKRAQEA